MESGPRFNYYIGNSQGGREALTVAQRYSADYDGILATVPVVSLSSLQLAPGPHPDSREATGELGDSSQSERNPRRVHAAV